MTLPRGDADDHVAFWSLGDVNDAETYLEFEGIVIDAPVVYPSGKRDMIPGYIMKVKSIKGLDFNTSQEHTVFIPNDLIKLMAAHMLKSVDDYENDVHKRIVSGIAEFHAKD